MKKILLLLILILLPQCSAYSTDINEYDKFLKTLKLTKKQEQKIEQINKHYSAEITKLNAQIILNNMQAAQLRPSNSAKYKINSINANSICLEEELQEIIEEKDKKILSCLNFFQKFKYKRYISNKY